MMKIRIDITKEEKDKLIKLLKEHRVVFTWKLVDKPRIDSSMACHKLALGLNVRSVK